MNDSDDTSPLRPRVKRRRVAAQSPTLPVGDSVATDGDTLQSPISTSYSVREIDGMIAELRATHTTKKRGNRHQIAAAEEDTDRVRSAICKREQEYGALEAALGRKQNEIEVTRIELSNLEKVCEGRKAAKLAKDSTLAKAATAIKDLEGLAKGLPALLCSTEFSSKEASMMNMLRSFHQDIHQKYFHDEGADQKPPGLQQLDNDTLDKLRSVMRGLKLHKHYQTFAQPVTEVLAPRYFEIIKHPIDLSMIRKKLDSGEYTSYSDFVDDAKLMFKNCHTYNPPESTWVRAASTFKQQMHHLLQKRGLGGL
jgi:Bromodomain